jgi:uncharacterized membrane protein YccC
MANFLRALACLFLACVVGEIVLCLGQDLRASNRVEDNLVVFPYIYGWMVMFAAPFWLFTFLPLYLAVPAQSFVWRRSVAPLIGLLIGIVGSLVVFGRQDFYAPRDLFFPAAIGFTVFLLGAILKNRSNTAPLA